MIVSLRGTVVSVTPLLAVIEAHGIGYEVHVPVTTAERLPQPGSEVRLFTVAVYREDSQSLYGFATTDERDFFKLLVERVSGVGPRVALTILSRLSLPVLKAAILESDVGLLAKCPGIGKKTAERLVVELRDKIGPAMNAGLPGGAATGAAAGSGPGREAPAASKITDAVKALVALGYRLVDAEKAVTKASAVLGAEASTEALVRRALSG